MLFGNKIRNNISVRNKDRVISGYNYTKRLFGFNIRDTLFGYKINLSGYEIKLLFFLQMVLHISARMETTGYYQSSIMFHNCSFLCL